MVNGGIAIGENKGAVGRLELAEIPGGEFLMGCCQGRADERPVHRVWVDAFAMSKTTVTNRQYREFVQETGGQMPESFSDHCFCHPDQPVVGVTWFEAMSYCSWLSNKHSQVFLLPTEAQWERAIRAGTEQQLYAWGNEDPQVFEYYRTGWESGPHCVALRECNSYGIYDLGDNVHEWCLDWYEADFYQRTEEKNPVNNKESGRRASRGGAWRHRIKASRCAARSSLPPEFAYTDYGFRVVRIAGEL